MCEIDYGSLHTPGQKYWYYSKTYSDLHRAVADGVLDTIKLELEKPNFEENLNKRETFQGHTPLHVAVLLDDFELSFEIAELLVNKGADVTLRDAFSKTPFDRALAHKKFDLAKYLIISVGKKSDFPNKDEYLKKCFFSILKNFANKKVDHFNFGFSTPILDANEIEKSTDLIEIILNQGLDVDSTDTANRTALSYAAISRADSIPLIRILLKHNPDVNFRSEHNITPLFIAVKSENLEIVKLLAENGADVTAVEDLNGGTPLHYACETFKKDIVKYLLEKGADLNAVDKQNKTPIFWACDRADDVDSDEIARAKTVKCLLNRNPNLNVFAVPSPSESDEESDKADEDEERKGETILEVLPNFTWAYKYHDNLYPEESCGTMIRKYLAKRAVSGFLVMDELQDKYFVKYKNELIIAKETLVNSEYDQTFFDILICEHLKDLLAERKDLLNILTSDENKDFMAKTFPNFEEDFLRKIQKV